MSGKMLVGLARRSKIRMSDRLDQLQKWMNDPEDEHLEFKEAKSNFHFEKLVKYCVALANEGGGTMILGVTDKRPRSVVGTEVFDVLPHTKSSIFNRLHFRIEAEEIAHPNGRVVVFHIPPHPLGMPIQYEGAYWMRNGEELAPMSTDRIKHIIDEAVPDYSAEICTGASLSDLDPKAIERFRTLWG